MEPEEHPALSEATVYEALRDVFGYYQITPSHQDIRWAIRLNEDDYRVANLLETYNHDDICNLVYKMVLDGSFMGKESSDPKNKQPAQKDDRYHQPSDEPDIYDNQESALLKSDVPFKTQHRVLYKLQTVLEEALFAFAKTTCPAMLTSSGWDCPEAANLSTWMAALNDRRYYRPSGEPLIPSDLSPVFVNEVLISVEAIGRTVAQRTRITGRDMASMARAAGVLLEALRMYHSSHADRVARILKAIEDVNEELAVDREYSETKLRETTAEIEKARAKLEEKKRATVAEIVREHNGFLARTGKRLEERVLASGSAAGTSGTNSSTLVPASKIGSIARGEHMEHDGERLFHIMDGSSGSETEKNSDEWYFG
ncbi:hypothetical protein B0T22DRAFT_472750 [Podospora appendiculata]|uniref:Uncharacterized protein n=1 Tax=Podospora appendiculata TaxID=314037 RepID=A0AAE0X041_9PEZI|nr:hypothetical protein B0T22DRAFT_472750 [Podospora appendiculata]